MTELTREDIFDQDQKETEYFENAPFTDEVMLPLTKLGFYALLKRVATFYGLPADDASAAVLAGYIHHIPNEKHTVTMETLGHVLHKSVANATSWRIDQEIKKKKREELEAQKKAQQESQALNPPVLPQEDSTPASLSLVE